MHKSVLELSRKEAAKQWAEYHEETGAEIKEWGERRGKRAERRYFLLSPYPKQKLQKKEKKKHSRPGVTTFFFIIVHILLN